MPQIQIFLSEDNTINYDLGEEKVVIGRLADNGLQIEDASVSSHHAEIYVEDGKYHLHDLGSTNGTFVNGEQVTDAILNHTDEIRFGRVETVFADDEEGTLSQPLPASPSTAAAVGSQSARPANFVSSSPVSRSGKKKDQVAYALYGLAALAMVSMAVAAYFVLSMQASA
jgi:pSer/pThr/pTyr-binding forkhead associated (FHA) protein